MKITIGTENMDDRIKISVRGCDMQKGMAWVRFASLLLAIAVCLLVARPGSAQSIISGEINGTVVDATHAVVPNATVDLLSTETGFKASVTTTSSGTFRFPLLRPGNYTLSVSAANFRTSKRDVTADVGQVAEITVQLEVGATTETVEVTATQPALDTENANLATTWNPTQIENIPNPGGDLTTFALTAPGIVLSTGAGYGNFSANGLGGTSNLYTINGGDMNDPYNNLNNSGASNNMLGANEIQEVALVTNGYTGQYGRAASVNMNFTTKSGGNSFHGNAKWDWNGRYLNANDWFNNATGTARPFANSNQWGGSIGGPIIKNKLYFYYDNEGLRYVLPGGGPVYIPTTQWAADVQANINATQPTAEQTFYQTMFTLYAGAPGGSAATGLPIGAVGSTDFNNNGGCGDYSGTTLNGTLYGVTFPTDAKGNPTGPITASGAPCTKVFHTGVVNLNKERLQSVRIDYEISAKDHLSGRYWQDRGTQPSYTDPINSAFNVLSIQPQDAGQLTETHSFSSTLVNQLIIGGFYYSAIFGQVGFNQAVATFPTTMGEAQGGNACGLLDGNLQCMGGETYRFPQGRNIAQYQLVDDVSWTKGNHALKFGVNFRGISFTDHGPSARHSGQLRIRSITDFVNGVMTAGGPSSFRQRFSDAGDYLIHTYSLGFYFQDEWRVKSNLKLTASLRLDHNANETCRENCFDRFNGGFDGISHSALTPYNQSVLTGQSTIFPSVERIAWQPRAGFAWTPAGDNGKTVIRGGIGIFSDLYPAQLSTNVLANAPNVSSWTLAPTSADIPIAPGVPGGAFSQVAADQTALKAGFSTGGTLASMAAAAAAIDAAAIFGGPDFYTTPQHMLNPKYVEWNLQIEHAITSKLVASINYVGNHGTDEMVQVAGRNAWTTRAAGFDNIPVCSSATTPPCSTPVGVPASIGPTGAPDPRFSNVPALTNNGISNYNGLSAVLTTKALKGLTTSIAYTYSHSLDDISNGGIDQYALNDIGDSILYQLDPQNLRRLNYSRSDYDFPHVFNMNYVWDVPFLRSNRWLGGWTISGTLIKRSGEPYSVARSASGVLKNDSAASSYIMSHYDGLPQPSSCHVSNNQTGAAFQCLNPADFSTARTSFGTIRRNSFRGPGYFDTDFAIKKAFSVTKNENGLKLVLGANAYNILNHPNFYIPDNAVGSGTFGQIYQTATASSSPYGNFQGSAVSGRILQLQMELKF
jgi:hypothetical protein